MEFGMYPQWTDERNGEDMSDYITIGINDTVYINQDPSHAHAYVDWEKNRDIVFSLKNSPLQWKILEETDDTLFVLSQYGIECRQFHGKNVPTTWEDSDIRKWLNGTFLVRAFDETEQDCILEIEIENEFNPVSFVKCGAATRDKIFLLSFRDVLNVKYGFEGYVAQSYTREMKNTDWSRIRGALTNPEKGMGWWWLRNAGRDRTWAGRVDYSGFVYFDGRPVTEFGSVRPALYLDKTKLLKLGKLESGERYGTE